MSYEKIRAAAVGAEEPPIARSTAIPYREALVRLFQLDPVPAWSPTASQLKEGVAAREAVRVYAQAAEAEVNHFRTYRGDREVDLIVKGESGRALAVEVKLAATPAGDAGAHLNWLQGELGDELLDKLITTGPSAYRRADGIAVVPAGLLGP